MWLWCADVHVETCFQNFLFNKLSPKWAQYIFCSKKYMLSPKYSGLNIFFVKKITEPVLGFGLNIFFRIFFCFKKNLLSQKYTEPKKGSVFLFLIYSPQKGPVCILSPLLEAHSLYKRAQYSLSKKNQYDRFFWYGVATVSRIDKIVGLFCRISSLL